MIIIKAPKFFLQIPINVVRRNDLTPVDKLVFGEIHTMLNVTDKFWMSNSEIAKRISKSRSTVKRSVRNLHNLGLIALAIKHVGSNKSRRFIYDPTVGSNMNRGSGHKRSYGRVKNDLRIDHTNKSVNRSLNSTYSKKRNYRSMIIKDLQALMVNINSFVADDIDNWLNDYDPKLILKAIHQVGSTSPSPTWVVKDVSTQLHRGCRIHQPRQRNNYGHAPIKEHVPDWAKDGYKPKLHRTSPKLQAKIRKQLSDLGYGKNDKHGKH